MSTHLYDVWHTSVPSERVSATTSFAARKAFAAKHHRQVSECMARRIYAGEPATVPSNASAKPFSDGTSIRDEP